MLLVGQELGARLFATLGLHHVADLAIAMHIYLQAKERGRGTWIEVPEAGA